MPHKNARNDLTAEYVRSILNYDPETGLFKWKYRPTHTAQWNGRYVGTIAGQKQRNRIAIAIDKKRYTAGRLAWLYVTGEWPPYEIDHIDTNWRNNKFSNLRTATSSENMRNQPLRSNNTSGFKGVYLKRNKWAATICVNWRHIYIGSFNTPEAAHAAYCRAAAKYHGQFSRTK